MSLIKVLLLNGLTRLLYTTLYIPYSGPDAQDVWI